MTLGGGRLGPLRDLVPLGAGGMGEAHRVIRDRVIA